MLYEITVPYFVKALNNLYAILDKATAYADQKKFEPSVFLQSRLAPDQFPFIRQVQITCDVAKLAVFRLTDKEAPFHDDKETNFAELKKRIKEVVTYLNSVKAADFQNAETKKITQPRWQDKYLTGTDYIHHHAIPNLYFHLTTAYAILRHNGVDVGKSDYLGEMPFKR